jgi:hypothetical protein
MIFNGSAERVRHPAALACAVFALVLMSVGEDAAGQSTQARRCSAPHTSPLHIDSHKGIVARSLSCHSARTFVRGFAHECAKLRPTLGECSFSGSLAGFYSRCRERVVGGPGSGGYSRVTCKLSRFGHHSSVRFYDYLTAKT